MPAIPPAKRLLTVIKKAEQATQLAKEDAVARAGLTKAQYNALLILADQPGLTGAELARRCFVTPQAMNETVSRLERDAFVERHRHPTHQHVLEVILTTAGVDALEAADRHVRSVESRIRAALTATERTVLTDLLGRVEDSMSPPGP